MTSTGALLLQFYKEVWVDRNLDAIDRFFGADETSSQRIPERRLEISEIREWMEIFHSCVANIDVKPMHVLEDGDWASAVLEVTCNEIDTGRPVKVYQHVMSRQRNGRLVESYPQIYLLRFFEQLGRLPPHSYELLMGGNRLT